MYAIPNMADSSKGCNPGAWMHQRLILLNDGAGCDFRNTKRSRKVE